MSQPNSMMGRWDRRRDWKILDPDFDPLADVLAGPRFRSKTPNEEVKVADQREHLSGLLDQWLDLTGVRTRLEWERRPEFRVRSGNVIGAVMTSLVLAITQSKGLATCTSCGRACPAKRQPSQNRRNYCRDRPSKQRCVGQRNGTVGAERREAKQMSNRRRGSGEGTIRKRADGRWEGAGCSRGGVSGREKSKSIYGRTRRDVADKLRSAQTAADQGTLIADERLTLNDWFKHWTDTVLVNRVANGSLSESTRNNYKDTVRLHLTPIVGRIRVTRLEP